MKPKIKITATAVAITILSLAVIATYPRCDITPNDNGSSKQIDVQSHHALPMEKEQNGTQKS